MVAVVVGRIGRPHGIRGEVTVEIRTDRPEERFAPSAVLATEPPDVGPLVVRHARRHAGALLVSFEGVIDRTAASALRGARLLAELGDERLDDPDEYHVHQLVGLSVVSVAGEQLGTVRRIVPGAAQDLVVVGTESGEVLVPFVGQIVPEVDLAGRRLVVDPPGGLFADAADGGAGTGSEAGSSEEREGA